MDFFWAKYRDCCWEASEQPLTEQGEGVPGFLKVISIIHAVDRRAASLRSVEKVFSTG